MRYTLNSTGYIDSVFWGCSSQNCKEYTGKVPTGYGSLLDWANSAVIGAYRLDTSGNLVKDSAEEKRLLALYEAQVEENTPVRQKDMSIYPRFIGVNPIISASDDTPDTWAELGYVEAYFNKEGCLSGKASGYGFLTSRTHDGIVVQEWYDHNDGGTYKRVGYVGDDWTPNFYRMIDDNCMAILYEGDPGSAETITLFDSAENCSMIEIVVGYADIDAVQSIKIHNPNGKTFDISSGISGSSTIQIQRMRGMVSGDQIIVSSNDKSAFKASGGWTNSSGTLYIKTVIGYY